MAAGLDLAKLGEARRLRRQAGGMRGYATRRAWSKDCSLADVQAIREAADDLAKRADVLEAEARAGVPLFHVTINYRTASGCNSKMLDVRAIDGEKAYEQAAGKVRAMRGVMKVDGGDVVRAGTFGSAG